MLLEEPLMSIVFQNPSKLVNKSSNNIFDNVY